MCAELLRLARRVLRLLAVQVEDARGVVLALRPERARELVVAVRLGVLALLLERTPERIVRVVVGGRELEHLAELLFGLVVALDPEISDPERLSDRRLLG